MKKIKKILIIFILLISYIYALAINAIPSNIILFAGEELKLNTIFGLTIKNEKEEYQSIETSTNLNSQIQNKTIEVTMFDILKVKEVDVSVIENTTVIPVGTIAGVKLYTNGVLVVGMSEIKGLDNEKYKPYENSGIQEGDTIIEINEKEILNTNELIQTVNQSNGEEIQIQYVRDGNIQKCSIKPIKTSNEDYKIGLWVRDSAAGVGTVTFYEPESKMFGALGHGITDIDTDKLINISSGEFVTTKILSIVKGENGKPGRIQGTVENQKNIGTIYKNTGFGIYGKVDSLSNLKIDNSKQMKVAMRSEINLGEAYILCNIDGTESKQYKIEIEKIYPNNNSDNKSMEIKITDEELLNKTGGIIQGMSGSPIIQNGKFIGAITHVFVNDPTYGYAIFGDLMIKQMKSVEQK